MKHLFLISTLIIAGCASSGVVQLSSEKYIISKNTAKVGGGISMSATAEVHEEANAFCASKGKKVETIDLMLSPGRIGSLGSVTLQFKCV